MSLLVTGIKPSENFLSKAVLLGKPSVLNIPPFIGNHGIKYTPKIRKQNRISRAGSPALTSHLCTQVKARVFCPSLFCLAFSSLPPPQHLFCPRLEGTIFSWGWLSVEHTKSHRNYSQGRAETPPASGVLCQLDSSSALQLPINLPQCICHVGTLESPEEGERNFIPRPCQIRS